MIQLVGLTAETDILDIDPGHLAILGRYRGYLVAAANQHHLQLILGEVAIDQLLGLRQSQSIHPLLELIDIGLIKTVQVHV